MEVVSPRCSGLDVHKCFVVACMSLIENGERHKEIRQFSTMSSDLQTLKEWLQAAGCTHIALESTGVYWKPIFHVLEGAFEMFLVKAQHMCICPWAKNGCQRCRVDRRSVATWEARKPASFLAVSNRLFEI